MVTDRCATTCLLLVLSFFYPHWLLLWQTLVALDISSHWIQMYMSLLHGETTHKVTDLAANPIMRLYYSRVRNISNTSVLNTGTKVCRSQWLEYCSLPPFLQPVLFTFCAGNELFFAALYILYFTPGYVGISQNKRT